MIYANEIDKFGKVHKSKKIKEGNCIIPFKYKSILHNDCIEGKSGNWCATTVNDKGTMQTFAYCKNKEDSKIKIKNKTVKLTVKKEKGNNIQKKMKIENKKELKLEKDKKKALKLEKERELKNIKSNIDMKSQIIEELEVIKKSHIMKKDTWRIIAYNKAIKALRDHDGEIKSMDDVKKIKNIGEKIEDKIGEILKTGKLAKAEELRDDPKLKLIDIFSKIMSVGGVTVLKIINEYNIKSLDELKKKADELGLNDKIKMGLKYYEDLVQKIPRKEMDEHNKYITEISKDILKDFNSTLEMVGSYRRGALQSGDLDIIIRDENNDNRVFKKLINNLIEKKYILETISYGNKKFSGICKLPGEKIARRIDVLFTTKKEYPFAMLYFTGSGDFNKKMRFILKKRGLKLNEYTLKKKNEEDKYIEIEHDFKTEKDIFNYLGFTYIEPKDRTDKVLE